MRLIHVDTLELVEFLDNERPPYNILSHRWTNDEPTYKEFKKRLRPDRAGFRKIVDFCAASKRISGADIAYVWVDTVCIDKRSSAELSEAINGMWAYYTDAHCCFVHLHDVPPATLPQEQDRLLAAFQRSQYWTRGWTLQEVIAPRRLIFFTGTWDVIGSKHSALHLLNPATTPTPTIPELAPEALCRRISAFTGIAYPVLRDGDQRHLYSVAQRLSWAAHRRTSRAEDRAYCLLGLLDLHMPLLYGEGARAFQRLQLELIRVSHDRSLLAWTSKQQPLLLLQHDNDSSSGGGFVGGVRTWVDGVLAPAPDAFERAGQIVRYRVWGGSGGSGGGRGGGSGTRGSGGEPYTVNNQGLELVTAFQPIHWTDDEDDGSGGGSGTDSMASSSSSPPPSSSSSSFSALAPAPAPARSLDSTIYAIPLDSFSFDDPEHGEELMCYVLLARHPCGHYRRILSHLLAWADSARPLPRSERFHIHRKSCEDAPLRWVDTSVFQRWEGPQGRKILHAHGFSLGESPQR